MKHRVLLALSLLTTQYMLPMELQNAQSPENAIAAFRRQQAQGNINDHIPLKTYAPPGLVARGEFVTISMENSDTPKLHHSAWKAELAASIKAGKTTKLLQLLSPEGLPTASRGLNFTPYQNALEQVRMHKNKEVRILTNTAEPDAKCCKCCNPTYMWNRHIAPGVIVFFKAAQLGFAGWAVYRAAYNILATTPTDYAQAALNAAPAIGALAASAAELPFSLINAWRRRILKTQQAKYEYYVLAEHNIETHDNIERIVQQNQKGINQLLAQQQPTQEAPLSKHIEQEQLHDNNMEIVDLNAQFGDGILLENIK